MTCPSTEHTSCCFTRCKSSRCNMLKEMLVLRAPEKSLTGREIRPKVRYPDQTDAAIDPPPAQSHAEPSEFRPPRPFDALTLKWPVTESRSSSNCGHLFAPLYVVGKWKRNIRIS